MKEVDEGKAGEISLPLQLALTELINKFPSISTVSQFIVTMFIFDCWELNQINNQAQEGCPSATVQWFVTVRDLTFIEYF